MRYPRFGAADENSIAIYIIHSSCGCVLCSFIQCWPRQNWSDVSKLRGDETISQCSDFNSTPWGNIVSSHYSSSRGRHTHSMQLLSSMARVFSCAPETIAYVMYKLNSCHVAPKDHSAMIKILKWCLHRNFIIILGVKCIKHHSLDETFICWNGVAYKVLIKKAECHESLGYCDLPHCLCWICSLSVRLAQHQWSVPVPHSSSLLALCTERHKLQPWWTHAALIFGKTVRGYMGNPASYLGGRMISPTHPY